MAIVPKNHPAAAEENMLKMRIRSRALPEQCQKIPRKASQEALNVAAGANALTRRRKAEGEVKKDQEEEVAKKEHQVEAVEKEEEGKMREDQAEEDVTRETKPVKADVEDLPKARAAREARPFQRNRIESGTNSSFLK